MQDGESLIQLDRLKKRAEFLYVRGGRAWRASSFVMQARRRPASARAPGETTRFGFTATRRLGPAVTRNRARRRLKETVRLIAGANARAGYDYVMIARRGAVTQPFEVILKELRQALAGIHKE